MTRNRNQNQCQNKSIHRKNAMIKEASEATPAQRCRRKVPQRSVIAQAED